MPSIIKSDFLTSIEGVPSVLGNGLLVGGTVRTEAVTVTSTSAFGLGDKLRLCRLPTTAIIADITAQTSVACSTGAFSMGMYTIPVAGTTIGTLISPVDFFASTVVVPNSMAQFKLPGQDAPNFGAAMAAMPLWQALGLTSDPGGHLELVVAVTTSLSAPCTMAVRVNYVVG